MPADFEVQATQLPSDIILYKLMFWWLSKIMSAYSSSSESSVYNQGICLGQNWTALSAKAIQVLFVFFVRTAGTGKRETLCISRRMKNTIKSGVPKSFPIGRSYTIYPFGYLSGKQTGSTFSRKQNCYIAAHRARPFRNLEASNRRSLFATFKITADMSRKRFLN